MIPSGGILGNRLRLVIDGMCNISTIVPLTLLSAFQSRSKLLAPPLSRTGARRHRLGSVTESAHRSPESALPAVTKLHCTQPCISAVRALTLVAHRAGRGCCWMERCPLCRHRCSSILEHMVTFRREIRLWHETGVTQRALMIRDDADTCWLACQMQHGRSRLPARP